MVGPNLSKVLIALIVLLAPLSSAHAQSSPYDLRWQIDELHEIKRLDFTVLVDRFELYDIAINKGNCQFASTFNGAVELRVNDAVLGLGKALAGSAIEPLAQKEDPKGGFPLMGRFGDVLTIYVPNSCNIILVEVETSEGNWKSNFKP
jgi:hypothetical protein